jgi:hypothetical protein
MRNITRAIACAVLLGGLAGCDSGNKDAGAPDDGRSGMVPLKTEMPPPLYQCDCHRDTNIEVDVAPKPTPTAASPTSSHPFVGGLVTTRGAQHCPRLRPPPPSPHRLRHTPMPSGRRHPPHCSVAPSALVPRQLPTRRSFGSPWDAVELGGDRSVQPPLWCHRRPPPPAAKCTAGGGLMGPNRCTR